MVHIIVRLKGHRGFPNLALDRRRWLPAPARASVRYSTSHSVIESSDLAFVLLLTDLVPHRLELQPVIEPAVSEPTCFLRKSVLPLVVVQADPVAGIQQFVNG